jgi:mannose-6-phosphate isomerase
MDVITFSPLYMERVWGGRELEKVYGRSLPDTGTPFGESWEMTDRAVEQSVVSRGTFKGMTLGELWQQKREEVFGDGFSKHERFPLLIKILDARDDLSIQVHPPAEIAHDLGGEPKTEMWYIADALPDAKLYVGMKRGVTREDFQAAIINGTVGEVVHAITPKKGDSIFIPSGRLHAIGAGLLIYEIQQNSDTTYRVFDWNRMGLDGKPRQLHIDESMRCIDFDDIEPKMDTPDGQTLAHCPYFQVDQLELPAITNLGNPDARRFSIVTVVDGQVESSDNHVYSAGDFLLLPCGASNLTAITDATILQTTIPR